MTAVFARWRLPRAAAVVVFVAAYFAAFALCERGYGSVDVPSPFWIPDSVLLGALLLAPREEWWLFVAAIWPIRLILGSVPGTPLWFQFVTIANDAAKGLGSAWLIHRLIGRRVRLETLNELLIFFGVAAVAMPLLSTIAALPARAAVGDRAWAATYQWFLGDSLTQIVVTPAIVYWGTRADRDAHVRLGELLLLGVGLGATLLFAFVVPGDIGRSPVLLYALAPFLVWAAVRLGPFGMSNAISLVAVVSMVGTVRGTGVFGGGGASVLSLQLFLMLAAVSQLSLAVVITERTALLIRQKSINALLLQVQEAERTRIARELHDDVVQQLSALKIDLDFLEKTVDEAAAPIVGEASQHALGAVESLRNLSYSLHPSTIHVRGLVPSLAHLAGELSQNGLLATFTHERVPEGVEENVSVTIFRIAQEALHNAAKHSRAAHVSMHLSGGADMLILLVADDGVGFDREAAPNRGLGLVSMRERAEAAGGRLQIESSERQGTRLSLTIPRSIHRSASTIAM